MALGVDGAPTEGTGGATGPHDRLAASGEGARLRRRERDAKGLQQRLLAPFVELVEVTGPVASPMGPTIAAGLTARDRLAGMGADAVLDTAWRCAPDVTTETHAAPGASDPNVILLRQGGGLGRAVRLDTLDAALVSVCDGELTARSALVAISALLERPTDEALTAGESLIRRLAADGFLLAD